MTELCRWLFYLAMITAPLAFGAMEIWSLALVESLIFLAAFLFFCHVLVKPERGMVLTPALAPLSVFVVYILFQLVPLPVWLSTHLSPGLGMIIDRSVGIIDEPQYLALTLDRKATFKEFYRFAAYGLCFFLTLQLFPSRKKLHFLLRLMVALGAAVAVQALLQKVTAPQLLYWFRAAPATSNPMGPYVYRNHFAGFMEMIFPFGLCLFLWSRPDAAGGGEPISLRTRFVNFFQASGVNSHTLYGIAAVLIATSVFVSLSRGGVISLCLATVCFFYLLRKRHVLSGSLWWTLVPVATLLLVTVLGWQPLVERFLKTRAESGGLDEGRLFIWKDTLAMIRDFFVTGAGAGSYLHVFQAYMTRSFGGFQVDHAHNDYLEFMATVGIIGCAAFIVFLYMVVRDARVGQGGKDWRWSSLINAGGLAVMISIALHSVTDFNFYNGANPLYFMVVCAILVAVASWRQGNDVRPATGLRRMSSMVMAGASLLMLLTGAWFHLGIISGQDLYRRISNVYITSSLAPQKLEELAEASDHMVGLDPLESRYWLFRAGVEYFAGRIDEAGFSYEQAVLLDPVSSETVQAYGSYLLSLGDERGEALLEAGTVFDSLNPESFKRYARWLARQGDKEGTIIMLAKGMSLEKNTLKNYLPLMESYGFSLQDMEAVVPPEVPARLNLAGYLVDLGRLDEAREIYVRTLALLENESDPRPWYYWAPAGFFSRRGEYAVAIKVLKLGVAAFAGDAALWKFLGHNYMKNNQPDEAEDAYRQAVKLSPAGFEFQLQLANHLGRKGQSPEADAAFVRAVELLAGEKNKMAWHYQAIIGYYARSGMADQALAIALSGVKALPGDPVLRVVLGDAFNRLGKRVEAEESFRKALELDPNHEGAKKRLARFK